MVFSEVSLLRTAKPVGTSPCAAESLETLHCHELVYEIGNLRDASKSGHEP